MLTPDIDGQTKRVLYPTIMINLDSPTHRTPLHAGRYNTSAVEVHSQRDQISRVRLCTWRVKFDGEGCRGLHRDMDDGNEAGIYRVD